MSPIQRHGLMFVLSSPSGAGKTTITRLLLEKDPHVTLSISATTRPPRPLEKEGKDYFFKTKEEFESLILEDAFLEYAQVFDHFYGTPKKPVEEALYQGKDVLFDIDWQGAQALTQCARSDLVKVFILPPSLNELERRLKTRNQDPDHVVDKRMSKAFDEMSHWAEYDFVIVNHSIEETLNQVNCILHSERLRRDRQIGLSPFIKGLCQKSIDRYAL